MTGNITNWYGSCTAKDRKALQWVIKIAKDIIGTQRASINYIGEAMCLHRA